ncbi:MAG: hypothetical protein R3185_01405, partial [Candidatus Thermoplasmatota archaeon]|nr:hypothetical protein [Candidatus Thermoplasmatota archaeon]
TTLTRATAPELETRVQLTELTSNREREVRTYVATVANHRTDGPPADMTLLLTAPEYRTTILDTEPGAAVTGATATWSFELAPGETRTFELTYEQVYS